MDLITSIRSKIYDTVLKGSIKAENLSEYCLKDNEKLGDFKLVSRIGSNSVAGEVYKYCNSDACMSLKQVPILDSNEYSFLKGKDIKSSASLSYETIAELRFLVECNKLVFNKVTPNLPVTFKFFLCENCKFQGRQSSACLFLENELADGDLKNYLKKPRNSVEWRVMYFHVFSALYVIQKYLGAIHFDLHWGNVLFHTIQSGGYIHYQIEDQSYYVPNIGVIFVLWDFGFSMSEKLGIYIEKNRSMYTEVLSTTHKNSIDYIRIISAVDWCKEFNVFIPGDIEEMKNIVNKAGQSGMSVFELMKILFATDFVPDQSEIVAKFKI
jgi:hypothetical protein